MKILSWNLNHRTLEKKIAPEVSDALDKLDPDILVLTEFVDGSSRKEFYERLKKANYNVLISKVVGKKHNQILIASKSPMILGSLLAPLNITESLSSNILHVTLPDLGVDGLGLRIPDYGKHPEAKRRTWDWILDAGKDLRHRPSLICGDFNTDVGYSQSKCGPKIGELIALGFTHVKPPPEEASFWTLKGKPCRIDHAFLSPHLRPYKARYVEEAGGHLLASPDKLPALSDHAALEVQFEISF